MNQGVGHEKYPTNAVPGTMVPNFSPVSLNLSTVSSYCAFYNFTHSFPC